MRHKISFIIVALAVIKFVLPFLLQHPVYELHRDEYLYYQQGQHLDFGFLENPPLIGVLGYLSSMFGGGFFWIKFWSSLFGAATLLVTAGIVKELGGSVYAQVVAALGIILTGYLRIHFLFQPNLLDIFFWSLSAYFLLRYINTKENRFLYLLSLALALGWWSKYSVLFFAASLFIVLLLTQYRKVFSNRHLWQASALSLLFILPNLIWQYTHRWPLVHHMQELQETQLRYLNRWNFLKEQLLMLLPVAFVWIGGLIWLLRQPAYRIIAFLYLGIIVLLMMGSGKGYYALGSYPMLLAAGGVWLEKATYQKQWARYAVVALILLLALPFIPLLLPIQTPEAMARTNQQFGVEKIGILRWEDQQNHALQQDFADMIGWKELAQKSERFFQQLPDSAKANTIVYCRSYGQAGALKYYAQDTYFRQKVICDNGTFLLWIPDRLYFRHLLFIGHRMPDRDDAVFQHFQKVMVIDSVTNNLSRQYGDKIIFFENASDSAWQLANKGLREMKAAFGQ
ncbi:MAG: glycosyltransferase family 39 protein [Flavisolibacter sp.]|nr:glycosyltransferase family 39 protein [Flavisolibacter sp.]